MVEYSQIQYKIAKCSTVHVLTQLLACANLDPARRIQVSTRRNLGQHLGICILPYCTYFTVLYCILLFYTVFDCTVLYFTMLHSLYFTVKSFIVCHKVFHTSTQKWVGYGSVFWHFFYGIADLETHTADKHLGDKGCDNRIINVDMPTTRQQ